MKRISLGIIRRLIQETLLFEYKVLSGARLYHRSHGRFEVGDLLTAQKDPKTGQHWLASLRHEKELEDDRKRNHPELPSRFDCVFASFVPHSRFIGKGHLYVVEPIGRTFVANSQLIDELANNRYSSWSTIEEYWEGIEPDRGNIASVEVLMDKGRIVEVVDEKRLKSGDDIKFLRGAPQIEGLIRYYPSDAPDEYPDPMTYLANGSQGVSVFKAVNDLKRINGVEVLDKPKKLEKDDYSEKLRVLLGPGFIGHFRKIQSGEPGRKTSYNPLEALISPGPKYVGIDIEKEELSKLIRAFRAGSIVKQ